MGKQPPLVIQRTAFILYPFYTGKDTKLSKRKSALILPFD